MIGSRQKQLRYLLEHTNKLKWRYNHERNRNNKLRHARLHQRRVVPADHGKRSDPRGCAAEGEWNTEGANEMKVFTEEFEDVLVNFIGTSVVVFIILLLVGIVGWVEVGMWTLVIFANRFVEEKAWTR